MGLYTPCYYGLCYPVSVSLESDFGSFIGHNAGYAFRSIGYSPLPKFTPVEQQNVSPLTADFLTPKEPPTYLLDHGKEFVMHVPKSSFVCRALTYTRTISVLFLIKLLGVYGNIFDEHLPSGRYFSVTLIRSYCGVFLFRS